MMKIERWKYIPGEPNCVVAEFSVAFPHVTVDGLTLCRRRQSTGDGFVRVPKNGFNGERACRFSDTAYTSILHGAVDKHFEETGEKLCIGNKPEADPAAGLRRMLSAEHEACDRAGL